MRFSISTMDIAKRFSKHHRTLLRSIRVLLDYNDSNITAMFIPSSYQSSQNKELPCYEVGVEGFCLLTDTWGYSRGKSAPIKAQILSEFGEAFVVVGSAKSRFEDEFSRTLSEFLSDHVILRQFPIAGYKVDFYLPELGIIVEYDEEQHFSPTAAAADKVRMGAIANHYVSEVDDKPTVIRVRKGEEVRGLSKIAGNIALITYDACEITRYA